MATKKFVYLFKEGNGKMRELLGGKGANLAEMTNLGLPVPTGFTVTTEACTQYYEDGRQINAEIEEQIFKALKEIEKINGKKFGDPEDPLLVSVRSGARASMPGMMDTILNLGLNDVSVEGLARKTGNPRFAYDSYRRFIQMFSDVVMEQDKTVYERILDDIKEKNGYKGDTDLTADDLKGIVKLFKDNYKKNQGAEFPQDPKVQLLEATKAVFRSWDNPRANTYRRMNDIPYSWGTAVNVQTMVFGNKGETSGTGVAFTRDPATGEKKLFGEYLMNAQGEDVVAGIRTPKHIDELKAQNGGRTYLVQERVRRVARQPFYVRFARFRAGQIVEAERGDAADGSAVLAAVAGRAQQLREIPYAHGVRRRVSVGQFAQRAHEKREHVRRRYFPYPEFGRFQHDGAGGVGVWIVCNLIQRPHGRTARNGKISVFFGERILVDGERLRGEFQLGFGAAHPLYRRRQHGAAGRKNAYEPVVLLVLGRAQHDAFGNQRFHRILRRARFRGRGARAKRTAAADTPVKHNVQANSGLYAHAAPHMALAQPLVLPVLAFQFFQIFIQ